jgi:hypothetical protein
MRSTIFILFEIYIKDTLHVGGFVDQNKSVREQIKLVV